MQNSKRNIVLLISLGILLLFSAVLFWSGMEVKAETDLSIFRLSDPKSIDRIIIEKPNGKIELQFANGNWRVKTTSEDSVAESWETDRDLIDVLFATVQQATPRRAVAKRVRDSISNQISASGVKVSFLSNSSIQKIFLVLGDEPGGVTYFQREGDGTPYIVTIPGYRVYVAGIFVQDANAWRDKRIFNFNWRNFKELKGEFPSDPKQNFTVAMTERYFSIVGENKIDTTALNNYLDAVSLVEADLFYAMGESNTTDSLARTNPIMIVTVKDVADQVYTLSVFTIKKNERNALALWGDDLVWFDRRKILPIYKMRKDFVK